MLFTPSPWRKALATRRSRNPNGDIDLDSDFRDFGGYSMDPEQTYDPCRLDGASSQHTVVSGHDQLRLFFAAEC